MTDDAQNSNPTPPALIKGGVLLLSAIGLVSAIAGVGAALAAFEKPVFGLLGFEAVTVVAGVVGVLAGLGRFRSGYGLALLCVAGTFFTSAIFGLYLDARQNAQTPTAQTVVRYAILGRVALAGGLGMLAGLAVLVRDNRSWGMLLKGAALLAPVAAVGGWVVMTRGRMLTMPLEGALAPLRTVAVVLGGLVLMVVFAVGAHLCIRAFEITRPDDSPNAS